MKEILEQLDQDQDVINTSVHQVDRAIFFIKKDENFNKYLYILSDEENIDQEFEIESTKQVEGKYLYKLNLSNKNSHVMRKIFDWMSPIKRTGHAYSFGLGDRLGLASVSHLELFKDKDVLPVLAQQSIRELKLTGRTYDDVLSSAAWAVFEAGYHKGYGADGDHLKNPFEIDYAIKCGFKMITLDCSDHINNDVANYSEEKLKEEYEKLSNEIKAYLGETYLNKTFDLSDGVEVKFDEKNLMETVLIFNEAINFAKDMYHEFIEKNDLDFEVSIDETIVPTSPENHFFIAYEFAKNNVILETMAPKFHGAFQKAIDYVGNLDQFRREYEVHEAIAKHFGYRLSIHSGSDKFAVYPTISEISKAGWHVKTAGTNWLEALRVIARNDASLMLEIYEFALDKLDEAKAYYDIDATRENAIQLKDIKLKDIASLLDDDMTRQVLHVTFGLILQEKVDGKSRFKTKIYDVLKQHSDDYTYVLNKHIGKHLKLLNK